MNTAIFKRRVVGVDISLERTTYAVVDVRGNILAEDSFRTEDYPEINAFVEHLCSSILALVEANGGYESIRSVGISAPSGNYKTGCMENSPNMPWKGHIPLAAMLRDRLGIAVALGNNANVIALGEHAFGSAHGMKDFILITLGHGMGSSIFSKGRSHLGNDGFAGEVGHMCIIPDGRLCGCGNRGCLEAYVAAKGIMQTATEVMAESAEASLMRTSVELSPKQIASFCEQGDRLAQEVMRRTGFVLGWGLANYASVMDPEAIILTGGIPRSGKWLLEPMRESFDAHVFHNISGKVKILVSKLNNSDRDVLGASALAWDVKEYSLFK